MGTVWEEELRDGVVQKRAMQDKTGSNIFGKSWNGEKLWLVRVANSLGQFTAFML